MSNFKQKQNYPTGCDQMPVYNQGLPPLPTGDPTGPRYAPYPINPDVLSQLGMQPALQPGMQYGTQPALQPGMQYGTQPALQPGMQPALQPGMQYGTQPGMQYGTQPQPMLYPGAIPGGCQCLPLANVQNGMRARPMTPSGSIAPLPGTAFIGGEQSPLTTLSPLYTPGFLRTQIGRTVRVEFLVGTSGLTDRFGTLIGVGASYILIQEAESDDILLCDIYSIKFVRFYH